MSKGPVKEHKSIITRGGDFWTGCREELRKVSKPTRQETVQTTIVTIILMLFVAVLLGLMDIVFNKLMAALFS